MLQAAILDTTTSTQPLQLADQTSMMQHLLPAVEPGTTIAPGAAHSFLAAAQPLGALALQNQKAEILLQALASQGVDKAQGVALGKRHWSSALGVQSSDHLATQIAVSAALSQPWIANGHLPVLPAPLVPCQLPTSAAPIPHTAMMATGVNPATLQLLNCWTAGGVHVENLLHQLQVSPVLAQSMVLAQPGARDVHSTFPAAILANVQPASSAAIDASSVANLLSTLTGPSPGVLQQLQYLAVPGVTEPSAGMVDLPRLNQQLVSVPPMTVALASNPAVHGSSASQFTSVNNHQKDVITDPRQQVPFMEQHKQTRSIEEQQSENPTSTSSDEGRMVKAPEVHPVGANLPPEVQARLRKKIKIIQPISSTWEAEALKTANAQAHSEPPAAAEAGKVIGSSPMLSLAAAVPGADVAPSAPDAMASEQPKTGSVWVKPGANLGKRLPSPGIVVGANAPAFCTVGVQPRSAGPVAGPALLPATGPGSSGAAMGKPQVPLASLDSNNLAQVQSQLALLYHWYITNKNVYLEQAKSILQRLEQQQSQGQQNGNPSTAIDTSAVCKALEKAVQIMQASGEVEQQWRSGMCGQEAACKPEADPRSAPVNRVSTAEQE